MLYTWYQRLVAMYFLSTIDYLWLTLAISCHANIHTRRKELLYEHNFSFLKILLINKVLNYVVRVRL